MLQKFSDDQIMKCCKKHEMLSLAMVTISISYYVSAFPCTVIHNVPLDTWVWYLSEKRKMVGFSASQKSRYGTSSHFVHLSRWHWWLLYCYFLNIFCKQVRRMLLWTKCPTTSSRSTFGWVAWCICICVGLACSVCCLCSRTYSWHQLSWASWN